MDLPSEPCLSLYDPRRPRGPAFRHHPPHPEGRGKPFLGALPECSPGRIAAGTRPTSGNGPLEKAAPLPKPYILPLLWARLGE